MPAAFCCQQGCPRGSLIDSMAITPAALVAWVLRDTAGVTAYLEPQRPILIWGKFVRGCVNTRENSLRGHFLLAISVYEYNCKLCSHSVYALLQQLFFLLAASKHTILILAKNTKSACQLLVAHAKAKVSPVLLGRRTASVVCGCCRLTLRFDSLLPCHSLDVECTQQYNSRAPEMVGVHSGPWYACHVTGTSYASARRTSMPYACMSAAPHTYVVYDQRNMHQNIRAFFGVDGSRAESSTHSN